METKIIIAEKPSLARNIVSAIDKNMKRSDGYYYNDEYIVTYAFGHLFQLYDIEMYREDYSPNEKYIWKEDNLPFFPNEFRFGLKREDGVIKQYKIIRSLINRDDVSCIINAGDSDREGEIIIRLILKYALKKKIPIKRLWMPDQTPETIREEIMIMRDDADYDNLANEGLARTYIDWIYGINLTRIATIKAHALLRVGRVITPIVKAIYDRELEIENFVPKKYYVLSSKEKTNDEYVEIISKKELKDLSSSKILAEKYNNSQAIVTDITKENKIIGPGKLFSLSKLQGELGKKYKMSLDKSLQIVQSLYEKGFVSYPRTPSQYLAEKEKDKFKSIINNFQKYNINIKFKDSKSIFDDSKIESHSALTPTYKIPSKKDLSNEESLVYEMIAHRFFAVFASENYKIERTTITIKLGEYETFKLTGDVIIDKGWTVFETHDKKDKNLPKLNIGDIININFKPLEKQTNPPKKYTVETLNNFLKNPFKSNLSEMDEETLENEELKAMFEGVELGTEATRSGIINNAINSKYIVLKDNNYSLLTLGRYYIETCQAMNILIPKEKTAEIGKALKRVFKGEINIDEALLVTNSEVKNIFSNIANIQNINQAPRIFEVDKSKILCKCPKCGNSIAVNELSYRCANSGCGLVLYKNNKFFETIHKKLTKTLAKDIFTKGKVSFDDLVSKSGKTYKATIIADFSDKYVSFKLDFTHKD